MDHGEIDGSIARKRERHDQSTEKRYAELDLLGESIDISSRNWLADGSP